MYSKYKLSKTTVQTITYLLTFQQCNCMAFEFLRNWADSYLQQILKIE